jgi:hypothetical protein
MTGKIMHQMRVWPPAWTRPLDDRPPYIIWPIGGLLAWVGILAVYMSLDHTYLSRAVMWGVFAGWCIGVFGATIAHYMYRR